MNGRPALGVGSTDDDKFLAVEAFGLEPEPALAGAAGGVQPLGDDALEPKGAQACR
jgi:hypothetical protein